jgi:cytochrome c oxidase subunit 3
LVCLIRLIFHHLTRKVHVGFEAAIWYWHFVDVVWIFVFIFVYWWAFPVAL